jgi:hypothetical protein
MFSHDISRSQALTQQFLGFIARLNKDDAFKAMAEIMGVAWSDAGKKVEFNFGILSIIG